MQKVIQILRKPARWIVIGTLIGLFLFTLIGNIGSAADAGDALLVLQVLLRAAVLGLLIAAMLYALIKNKKEFIGPLAFALLAYAIIAEALLVRNGSVAIGVFGLLAVLALCLTVVMELIGLFLPSHPKAKLFRLLALAGIATYCALNIGSFISSAVAYGRVGAEWYNFFAVIAENICLPVAIAFGYLLARTEDVAFAEPAPEEPKAESEPEAAPEAEVAEEEPKAEETPAKEPSEEPAEESETEKAEEPEEKPAPKNSRKKKVK